MMPLSQLLFVRISSAFSKGLRGVWHCHMAIFQGDLTEVMAILTPKMEKLRKKAR